MRFQREMLLLKSKDSFTLIETVLALFVSIIGIFLINGVLISSKTTTMRQPDLDRMNVEQFFSVISSEKFKFQIDTNFKRCTFRSKVKGKENSIYDFKLDRNKLWMRRDLTGYMPFLYDVTKYNWSYNPTLKQLKIEVQIHNRTYSRTFIMETYHGQKSESTI